MSRVCGVVPAIDLLCSFDAGSIVVDNQALWGNGGV